MNISVLCDFDDIFFDTLVWIVYGLCMGTMVMDDG